MRAIDDRKQLGQQVVKGDKDEPEIDRADDLHSDEAQAKPASAVKPTYMKRTVIGTKYLSFSPMRALTEVCAASSNVPLEAIDLS